jgi:hypothetical protein
VSARPALLKVGRGVIVALTLAVAIVTVGLTASQDGPFFIAVQPVFLRLGVDVDVKVGSVHLHASWSALSSASSTKTDEDSF